MFMQVKRVLHRYPVRVGYYSRPSFLIIGAQKAGTSALYEYLSVHPNIVPAATKELHFFSKQARYDRGETWYHSNFPYPYRLGKQGMTFDATPNYLYWPGACARIAAYDPTIKMIALLRNPIERAFSQWNMNRHRFYTNPEPVLEFARDVDEPARTWIETRFRGAVFPDFDEVIQEELALIDRGDTSPEPSHLRRGLYHEQLSIYFAHFSREQILVLDNRLLKTATQSTLDRVTRFLNLPSFNWSDVSALTANTGTYDGMLSDKTRASLREFYQPHNERLYQLLGHDFEWK